MGRLVHLLDDGCRHATNVAQLFARPCAQLSTIRNSRAKSGLGTVFMKTQGEKSELETRLLFMGGRILLHRTGGDWRAFVYLPGATECEPPILGSNRDKKA